MKNNNSRILISEMRSMLKPNKRKGLFEGLVYGESDEELNDMGIEDEQIKQEDEKLQQQSPNKQTEIRNNNPLDEDPEITKLITNIRVETLQGLTKLASNPESSQYELLKKIFLLIDKAVEDKIEE